MKKSMVVLMIFLFLTGCASFARWVDRTDENIFYETFRFPCEDRYGKCIDDIDEWVFESF